MFFAGQDDENEIVTENAAFVHGEPCHDADGPPKVDSAVEILQEKVTKQIIKEGHGQKPSKYSTCFCKYQYYCTSSVLTLSVYSPLPPSPFLVVLCIGL